MSITTVSVLSDNPNRAIVLVCVKVKKLRCLDRNVNSAVCAGGKHLDTMLSMSLSDSSF